MFYYQVSKYPINNINFGVISNRNVVVTAVRDMLWQHFVHQQNSKISNLGQTLYLIVTLTLHLTLAQLPAINFLMYPWRSKTQINVLPEHCRTCNNPFNPQPILKIDTVIYRKPKLYIAR